MFRVIAAQNSQNTVMTNTDWITEFSSYVNLLRKYQNFELLILPEITMLTANATIMIKQERHVVINTGDKQTPVILYSDQTALPNEGQQQFDKLWGQEGYSEQLRDQTISKLETLIQKIKN